MRLTRWITRHEDRLKAELQTGFGSAIVTLRLELRFRDASKRAKLLRDAEERVEHAVSDVDDAGGGLVCALVEHEVGDFFVEVYAGDFLAARFEVEQELFVYGLVVARGARIDAKSRDGRLIEIAYGRGVGVHDERGAERGHLQRGGVVAGV